MSKVVGGEAPFSACFLHWGKNLRVSILPFVSILFTVSGTEPAHLDNWSTTEPHPSLSLVFRDLFLLFLNCLYMCMPLECTHEYKGPQSSEEGVGPSRAGVTDSC